MAGAFICELHSLAQNTNEDVRPPWQAMAYSIMDVNTTTVQSQCREHFKILKGTK